MFKGCVKNWKAFSLWDPSSGGLDYLLVTYIHITICVLKFVYICVHKLVLFSFKLNFFSLKRSVGREVQALSIILLEKLTEKNQRTLGEVIVGEFNTTIQKYVYVKVLEFCNSTLKLGLYYE